MTNIIDGKRINQIFTFLNSLNIRSKRFTEIIKTQNFAKDGDTIVVVAGMPFGISGSTNSIRVVEI